MPFSISNPAEHLPPGIEQKVLTCIADASRTPSRTITRRMLIWKVFGASVSEQQLNNNRLDRQVRKAIENLRLRGYPIVSSSAGKGYGLVTDRKEIEGMISEMEGRREALAEQIRALRRANNLPATYQAPQKATQLQFTP
jgi:hypothetical protein